MKKLNMHTMFLLVSCANSFTLAGEDDSCISGFWPGIICRAIDVKYPD
ncbi:MAG: hypothetical protein ACK5P5_09275 [Pseudobdellovibrionaceae bacterium]